MADLNTTQDGEERTPEPAEDLGPAIDDETVERLERSASSLARGQQRRLCLIACSQSVDTLSKLRTESPEAFAEMLELVAAFEGHAQGLHEVATAALARLLIADSRASV